MATFNLREELNKIVPTESIPAGGTSTRFINSGNYSGVSTAPNYLAAGAHTFELKLGDRVLSSAGSAIAFADPQIVQGYAATATFSFTFAINGVLSSNGTTLVLNNGRGTSANVITVGKEGSIGGVNHAIQTDAKTTITNNGLIAASAVSTEGPDFDGSAIFFNGFGLSSNLNPASVSTVTNNLGAVIDGGDHGIFHDSLGALVVTNKGSIIGSEATNDTEGDGGAVFTWNGKLTLLNDVGASIYGTVRAGWLESKVENKGFIDGTIKAHLYGEEEGGPNSNTDLTGFIDIDRDGTPSSTDPGDKHLNTITTTGITVTNTGQIDGTNNWFSENEQNIEVAMDLTRAKDVVTNSGRVFGLIKTREGSDIVTNDAAGKIYGTVDVGSDTYYDAIGSFAGGFALDADAVTNKGLIAGDVLMGIGKDVFVNNGEIYGRVEVGTGNYFAANAKDEDYDAFTNTGTIGGNVWTGLGDDVVTNSGLLKDGLDTSAWLGTYDPLTGNWTWDNDTTSANKDFDNDKDTVNNTGTIRNGVYTGHGADKVTNTNLIDGWLDTASYIWVGNDEDAPVTATNLGAFEADDNDLVDNKGTISGGINTGLGADTVTNAGVTQQINTSEASRTITVGPNETTINIVVPTSAAVNDKDVVNNTGTVWDSIWTGFGDDKITNAATGKVVFGGIYGDAGNDIITNAGYVNAEIDAGDGSDTITNTGTVKGDIFLGTDSATNKLVNSKYIGGSVTGNENFDSAQGNNTVENAGVIEGDILLGGGSDTVKNTGAGRIEGGIYLGGGVDNFVGNASSETVYDEAGGDTYTMGAGRDRVVYLALDGSSNRFDGGADEDRIDFSFTTDNAIVNLSTLTAQSVVFSGSVSQTDTLLNFETVFAGGGNDQITGSALSNTIFGGAGTDTISGGGGQDFLYGGADADTFVFNALTDSLPGLADIIQDFEDGLDKIDLSFIGSLTQGDFTTAATTAAAQWRAAVVGDNTILEVNTDSDLQADMVIYLAGNIALDSSDFL
jgi:hypothetical protein